MDINVVDNSVIIVGAGRSGTTMLKEALSKHPDLSGTQYELNHLWRYGNSWLSHDMLDPDQHFSKRKAHFIRKKLSSLLEQSGKQRLVEKTVANVMRLRYVYTVLPQAKVIHIIRDGRAVTASSMKRWRTNLDTTYLASKVWTIPIRDVPWVGFNYLKNRLRGFLRGRDYIQSWGPRWPGIDRDVAMLSLPEICAKQWLVSLKAALEQKPALPENQYLEVRYEEVVTRPVELFTRIAEFLEIDPSPNPFQEHIQKQISDSSLNIWKSSLSGESLDKVRVIIGDFLERMEYL